MRVLLRLASAACHLGTLTHGSPLSFLTPRQDAGPLSFPGQVRFMSRPPAETQLAEAVSTMTPTKTAADEALAR